MRSMHRAILALLLCLSLCLILAPGAFAEGEEKIYDSTVIVGFDLSAFSNTIDLDHKYALIALQQEFPEQLTVYTGGTVYYSSGENGVRSISRIEGYSTQYISVTWACLEDYDQGLEVFHFIPVLDDYSLAEELSLPVIRVNILGELQVPYLTDMPAADSPTWFLSDSAVFNSSEDPGISSYNGFELGILPAVRDQGQYGACWAFSTIACIEADMIHDGAANTGIDLSELHLAHYVYHDYYDEKGCNQGDTVSLGAVGYLDLGGNAQNAGLTLANLVGPVPESVAPYSAAYSHPFIYEQAKASNAAQLAGMYEFDPHDVNAVKNAILAHGAVSTSVRIYDNYQEPMKYYSATNNSFYYPTGSVATNHAVTLVGWDDSFSRNKFLLGTPEGNGAWLVRNSWGVNGNDFGGYFWMSYYDKSLSNSAFAFDAQDWQYQHCYAYDNIPTSSYYQLPAGLDISQSFHVDGGEQIEAIGFYNGTPNVQVDFTVTCGNESATASRYFKDAGYYLVPLSQPLLITTASDVTASFVCTCSGNTYVFCESGQTSKFSDGSLAYSFTSSCGGGISIPGYDLGTPVDLRLKLFTNDAGVSGVAVSAANFPDPVFRAYVSSNFDTDRSGYLDDAEIAAVIEINVRGSSEEGAQLISSLKGIELFPSLAYLDCAGNTLKELDVSQNTALEGLICGIMDNDGNELGNQLSKLDVSKNKLLGLLYCCHNQITTLDVSGNTNLLVLYCYNNGMTQLNTSGCTKLAELSCGNNQLTTLNVSSNAEMKWLFCYNNNLSTLNLAGCTALQELVCSNNNLSNLDLSSCSSLRRLSCFDNPLTSFDITPCPVLVYTRYAAEPLVNEGVITYYDTNYGNAVSCDETDDILIYGLLDLPADLTEIEEEAFAGASFTYVLVPEGTVSVGPRAFANCPNLTYVLVRSAETAIDPSAFENSNNVSVITLTASAVAPAA